jgi:hypothetical protein
MKRIFLAIFSFILALGFMPAKADAQVLYKVNFHDKTFATYEGLLVYFNESRAYMRISYYSKDNRYHVVNVDYKSASGTYNDGTNYFFMSGANPHFITENSKDQTYNPDYFIWRKGRYDNTWDISTTDDVNLSRENEIPVDSFYQVEPNTVSEAFLRKFFWNNESEFYALKKLCSLDNGRTEPVITTTTKTTTTSGGAKLHLIIVANTMISDIGASCIADRDKLDYEFSSISDALGLGYRKYVVDGTNFNKANVDYTLNLVHPAPNDVVVFIYRGHGFRWDNQTDAYPMMDLRPSSYMNISQQNSMSLSYVYNAIKAKGARLNLVLADCCNNKVGISQITGNSFLNLQADNKPDLTKLKRLFVNAKGSIISAAAKAGEYSWANPLGGFFTISFIQALKEKIGYLNNGSYSWNDILSYATQLARDKSSPGLCSNCTIQNGITSVSVTY